MRPDAWRCHAVSQSLPRPLPPSSSPHHCIHLFTRPPSRLASSPQAPRSPPRVCRLATSPCATASCLIFGGCTRACTEQRAVERAPQAGERNWRMRAVPQMAPPPGPCQPRRPLHNGWSPPHKAYAAAVGREPEGFAPAVAPAVVPLPAAPPSPDISHGESPCCSSRVQSLHHTANTSTRHVHGS